MWIDGTSTSKQKKIVVNRGFHHAEFVEFDQHAYSVQYRREYSLPVEFFLVNNTA